MTTGAVHYLGIRIGGKLARFHQQLTDDEFQRATANGLPPFWVAWHLEPGECLDKSERVKGIAKLPIVVSNLGELIALPVPESGPIISPLPLADGVAILARQQCVKA